MEEQRPSSWSAVLSSEAAADLGGHQECLSAVSVVGAGPPGRRLGQARVVHPQKTMLVIAFHTGWV